MVTEMEMEIWIMIMESTTVTKTVDTSMETTTEMPMEETKHSKI